MSEKISLDSSVLFHNISVSIVVVCFSADMPASAAVCVRRVGCCFFLENKVRSAGGVLESLFALSHVLYC